jgi:hypothetical protein
MQHAAACSSSRPNNQRTDEQHQAAASERPRHQATPAHSMATYRLELQCSWLEGGGTAVPIQCTVEAVDVGQLVARVKDFLNVDASSPLVFFCIDEDFGERVLLDDLADLSLVAVSTLILRYDGPGAPPRASQPPPPGTAPPPPASAAAVAQLQTQPAPQPAPQPQPEAGQAQAAAEEAVGNALSLVVEPCALVPGGRALQLHLAQPDIPGLVVALEAALGLTGISFMTFDADFEEWCMPAALDELGTDALLRITAGSHVAAAMAPPAAAADAPPAQPSEGIPPAPASASAPDSPGVEELVGMGFTRTASKSAMDAGGGDVQRAAELLLSSPGEDVSAATPAPSPPPSSAGSVAAAAGAEPVPAGGGDAVALLAVEARERGLSEGALQAMISEVSGVTGATAQVATQLLLAAGLQPNRAVEHFFSSGGGGSVDAVGSTASGQSSPPDAASDTAGVPLHLSTHSVAHTPGGRSIDVEAMTGEEEELHKQQLVDKLQAYQAATPAAQQTDVFDMVEFAWENMLESRPPDEIHRKWTREQRSANSLRMSICATTTHACLCPVAVAATLASEEDFVRPGTRAAVLTSLTHTLVHCFRQLLGSSGQAARRLAARWQHGSGRWERLRPHASLPAAAGSSTRRRRWASRASGASGSCCAAPPSSSSRCCCALAAATPTGRMGSPGSRPARACCSTIAAAIRATWTDGGGWVSARVPAACLRKRYTHGCRYYVAPPKQPRRGYPFCFRINADATDKKTSGKYLLAAETREEMMEWTEHLRPPNTRTRAEVRPVPLQPLPRRTDFALCIL